VVGRKNDYGSGSVWSGQWAACSPRCSRRLWLEAYLSSTFAIY